MQLLNDGTTFHRGSRKPIQLSDDQLITGLQILQQRRKGRPICHLCSGEGFRNDLLRTGILQQLDLIFQAITVLLLLRRANSRVSVNHRFSSLTFDTNL